MAAVRPKPARHGDVSREGCGTLGIPHSQHFHGNWPALTILGSNMVTSFNDFDRTSFVARASSGVYTSGDTARAPRVVRARRGRVSRAPRESDATADARTRVARSVRALHASYSYSITRLCIRRVRSPTFRGNCNHRYRRREPSRTVANRRREKHRLAATSSSARTGRLNARGVATQSTVYVLVTRYLPFDATIRHPGRVIRRRRAHDDRALRPRRRGRVRASPHGGRPDLRRRRDGDIAHDDACPHDIAHGLRASRKTQSLIKTTSESRRRRRDGDTAERRGGRDDEATRGKKSRRFC